MASASGGPIVGAQPVWRAAGELGGLAGLGPEGLDLICIGGRKPKDGDTERFPDFWD